MSRSKRSRESRKTTEKICLTLDGRLLARLRAAGEKQHRSAQSLILEFTEANFPRHEAALLGNGREMRKAS